MAVRIDPERTALVITDPQNDMLSEDGAAWAETKEEVWRNRVVPNLVTLRKMAAGAGIPVFYSPHLYGDQEYASWQHLDPIEKLMFDRRMYRAGTWGADWHPELLPDANTFVLSPHKVMSGFWAGDIHIQLRQRNIDTLILAGMSANLCVESHLRDAVENGFQVIVVNDATAGLGAAATQAARVNFQMIAHAVTSTKELMNRMLMRGEREQPQGYPGGTMIAMGTDRFYPHPFWPWP